MSERITRLAQRRAGLIAVAMGMSIPVVLAACTEPATPSSGAGAQTGTTVEIVTPSVSSVSSANGDSTTPRYKPVASGSASIRPRPGNDKGALAEMPEGFNRCTARREGEACAAIGDPSLEDNFGSQAARMMEAGPALVQREPDAPVQCCYKTAFQPRMSRGREIIVGRVARSSSIETRGDWM